MPHTGGRLDLGKALRDLPVGCKLLELGEGKVAKVLMPLHELSKSSAVLRWTCSSSSSWGLRSKVSGPILVVCVAVSLSFSEKRLLASTLTSSLVTPSENKGAFFWMLVLPPQTHHQVRASQELEECALGNNAELQQLCKEPQRHDRYTRLVQS